MRRRTGKYNIIDVRCFNAREAVVVSRTKNFHAYGARGSIWSILANYIVL